ncbi:MAG: hypothetical protein KJ887_01045 [Candidatus Omnitrophica bacterium]|nr:hypothetical protein [Candidatus Omnitrophota bacterium]MBU1047245.1 hypothetical protein [Candidatus Omnitrophota bacterium]MBU1889170.1 hypothetical protein [Candidatus Omnitrophota bacterium]
MKEEPPKRKPSKYNSDYFEKVEKAFDKPFETAKTINEIQFALSLNPEFRGAQDVGWCTASETFVAFDEYLDFINKMEQSRMRIRIALSFYCHLSEASGFYEIPKNMLRVIDGSNYSMWPFQDIVKKHNDTGKIITPNSNKIMRNIIGHAEAIGMHEVAEVFKEAFDSDIRNAYSHADYIIWGDGLRIRFRNGGYPKEISWEDFSDIFDRGINFFNILKAKVDECLRTYHPAKTIDGQLNNEPKGKWKIEYDPRSGGFSISTHS